jgi:hypothetical protein
MTIIFILLLTLISFPFSLSFKSDVPLDWLSITKKHDGKKYACKRDVVFSLNYRQIQQKIRLWVMLVA